jgi:hypothetical protein
VISYVLNAGASFMASSAMIQHRCVLLAARPPPAPRLPFRKAALLPAIRSKKKKYGKNSFNNKGMICSQNHESSCKT